ncbi:putative RZZ complex, subunit Zw10 protein [Dioscorea sansibarensis]
MDVLLGSIDVRELLSTHDFDEASPLSAPDLRLLIDRLQVRSIHIQDKVRDYVLSHRQDFVDIFSRCSDAVSNVDAVAASLSDALRLLSDRPIDLEIRDLVAEIRSKRRELEERREALAAVRTISCLSERLKSAREDLAAGLLVEASETVRDLKGALFVGDEHGEQEPAVFGLLRDEWSGCFDELQNVLSRSAENAVQFELEDGKRALKCWWRIGDRKDVKLYTVLEAMEVVGILNYGLAKVADSMIKHVMKPAVSNGSMNVFVEELSQDDIDKPQAILSLIPSSDIEECPDGSAVYSRIVQVIKFIYKFICFQNSTWMHCFGRLMWSRLSDLIITHFLSKAVPEDASKVADFESVMKHTAEFETILKKMTFISSDDSSEENLSHFTHNVELHFASKKRKEILSKARNILLQFDHEFSFESTSGQFSPASGCTEGFSEYEVNLLFQPEKCFISKAASQLMNLVHEALKDACLSSTRVGKEFYHAARDSLLLYKAIIPVKLEKQLDSISRSAIVMYNDCVYLAQEVLGLTFEYHAGLPNILKEQVVFVDLASNFDQMAEGILVKQVKLVDVSLEEALLGANGFQNTHQPQQFELAKFSIDQVVFILEKIHVIWLPLMPASVYRRTMCTILDFVFSEITKDMLLLDDMAAEETLQLQRLIHITLENLSSLFDSLVADVNEREKPSKNHNWDQLDKMIPSLSKFRKLADLLDMPLKSITSTWESGELANCGFTSSEVENFIKAIFTDSPLRKECLWRIQSINI